MRETCDGVFLLEFFACVPVFAASCSALSQYSQRPNGARRRCLGHVDRILTRIAEAGFSWIFELRNSSWRDACTWERSFFFAV